MATNSLQSLRHHRNTLLKRHPSDTSTTIPPSTVSSSLFLKPTSTTTLSTTNTTTTTFSLTPTTSSSSSSSSTSTTSTSQAIISYDILQQHLSAQNFRQADEETRRLLIVLAGEAAEKRGYVFFSEVQFIPQEDLKTIDELWKQHSNNKFGYSVQRRIWNKVNGDFTKFFIKVGWMKKLDTEVEQYNYRSFPTEFMWDNNEETPQGHLPLTNALRGTQLLNCILSHPAFDGGEEEDKEEEKEQGNNHGELKMGSKPLSNKRLLKPDYSF